MKISRSDVVFGGRIELPLQLYRARVVNTDAGKSSSGNPMTTLGCEVIEPESVNVNGSDFKIAGKTFNLWLVHVPHLIGKQTQSSQASVLEFCSKLKLDIGEEYDVDLHREYYLGQCFDIVLRSEEDFKRYPKKPGEKIGEIIKDGDGNAISNGFQLRANLSDVPPNCRPSREEQPY